MRRLPRFEDPTISIEKLKYCLDLGHPTGRHKARVFRSALGLGIEDVQILERMLCEGIATHEAEYRYALEDGTQRWLVEWVVVGRLGPLRFVSAWDCRPTDAPRLVSCYLKKV